MPRSGSCSRRRAATARASIAPCRPSSRRSTCTARRSTCARRSSTTSTSSSSSAERGAIFVEEETEVPEGEIVVFSAHGVAPAVHENAAARAACARSTPPARWSPRSTSRRASSPHEGYTIVLIGHEGHEEVEGTTGEAPDSIVLVQTVEDVDRARGRRPRPGRLHHPDDALGRRDDRRSSPALRERFPNIVGAEVRRHLLRDDQPPDRGQAARRRVRPRAGDRLAQLVELEPAGRGRPRARRRRRT